MSEKIIQLNEEDVRLKERIERIGAKERGGNAERAIG